jgi:hypothetical protein
MSHSPLPHLQWPGLATKFILLLGLHDWFYCGRCISSPRLIGKLLTNSGISLWIAKRQDVDTELLETMAAIMLENEHMQTKAEQRDGKTQISESKI